MKKRVKHQLRLAVMMVLAIAALVVVDGGQMGKARADLRIQARVTTPNLSVHYSNRPHHPGAYQRVHRPFVYRISPRDRAIARRLAWETGYRKNVLLDLRARGLTWRQIGRRLDIPRRVVRLAMVDGPGYRDHRGKKGKGHRGHPGRCGTGR